MLDAWTPRAGPIRCVSPTPSPRSSRIPTRDFSWSTTSGVIRFASPTALRHLDLHSNAIGRTIGESNADYRLVRLVGSAIGSDAVVEARWDTVDRELAVRARRVTHPDAGVLLWVRDETRIRHLEKMRRDFISNVSHELRTPLAAMRVMIETLESGALEDGPAAHEFVHRIGLEVEQMSQMVEELLELSALEGEQRPVPDEPVPVVDLLIAVDRLRPLIEDKEINLVFDVPDDIPPIRGDLSHLQHVLRNLVHNAVKFTNKGGTITIAARADRRPGGAALHRHRRRHQVGRPGADLRALLEGGQLAAPRRRGIGAGPGDRPPRRRCAPGHDPRRVGAGSRGDLRGHPAGRRGEGRLSRA